MPYAPPQPPASWRNLLNNGDMRINQRRASTLTTVGTWLRPVDRWGVYNSGGQTFSVTQDTTTLPSGFAGALLYTNTNAYALTAGDYVIVNQVLEGYDVQGLAFGAGGAARAATLSFWVKASVAGTYGGAIRINSKAYSYPFSYTVTAGAYQQVSITLPSHPSVAIPADNGVRYEVTFSLGSGATRTAASAFTWQAGNYVQPTGSVSLSATAGATWEITGVQLEAATAATPFEYRPYEVELGLCQRCFYQVNIGAIGQVISSFGTATANNQAYLDVNFPTTMRATPTTMAFSAPSDFFLTDRIGNFDVSTVSLVAGSPWQADLSVASSLTSMTTGRPTALYARTATGWLNFSADPDVAA